MLQKKARKHFLNEDPETEEKKEEIDNILIQQLIQKDKQIVKQQEQIEHLQRLLENQQILTLKAQEKVQLLESKEEIIEESKEKNKSLWQKIFRKLKILAVENDTDTSSLVREALDQFLNKR